MERRGLLKAEAMFGSNDDDAFGPSASEEENSPPSRDELDDSKDAGHNLAILVRGCPLYPFLFCC